MLLGNIRSEPRNTSHHEVYFPYICSRHNITVKRLELGSSDAITFMCGGTCARSVEDFMPICALERSAIYHPVKSICGVVEGYYITNGPCNNCEHPAPGVRSWVACQALCEVRTACTGWVWNTDSRCYLKGGNKLKWRKEAGAGGSTYAGPSSRSNTTLGSWYAMRKTASVGQSTWWPVHCRSQSTQNSTLVSQGSSRGNDALPSTGRPLAQPKGRYPSTAGSPWHHRKAAAPRSKGPRPTTIRSPKV